MKTQLQLVVLTWLLLLNAIWGSPPDPVKNATDWKKDPLLKSIGKSAQGVMAEYEAWSEVWSKSDKKRTEKDQIINRITEEFFITLMDALKFAPNSELQSQCIRFLDAKVPSEFDDLWSFVFIEFSNVAKGADGRPIHSGHLENLKKRAMKSK